MRSAGGLAKAVMGLTLAALTAFCALGFVATFEPMDRSVQILWCLIYAVLAAALLGIMVFLFRRSK